MNAAFMTSLSEARGKEGWRADERACGARKRVMRMVRREASLKLRSDEVEDARNASVMFLAAESAALNAAEGLSEEIKSEIRSVPWLLRERQHVFSVAVVFFAAFVVCTEVVRKSPQLSAALATAVALLAYFRLANKEYQASLVQECELANDDSVFLTVSEAHDTLVHAKLCTPRDECDSAQHDGVDAVMLHGFGASSFSFAKLQKLLARPRFGAVRSLAFDRPGFGLTPRTQLPDLNELLRRNGQPSEYSDKFGATVARALFSNDHWNGADDGKPPVRKRVLVGHSMGARGAILAANADPEQIAALVLIAPAVFAAPDFELDVKRMENALNAPRLVRILHRAFSASRGVVVFVLIAWLSFIRRILLSALFRPAARGAIVWLLRLTVYSRNFWMRGLQASVHDAAAVTAHDARGYGKPDRVRGWESSLADFALDKLASLKPKASPTPPSIHDAAASIADSDADLQRILSRLCDSSSHGVPVLIIHGENDRIVPFSNSRCLAKRINSSASHNALSLIGVPSCGHMPHEERPELIASLLHNLLTSLN
mmetsp:Transcript_11454/g.30847  ORF Transcript_11454/g.30847 Transcript_11454/m.30847 type:complete len:545 (-) Transcript_11454:126-1760(-)